jgi:RNA polymerase sigma factor (sigma-70 family)
MSPSVSVRLLLTQSDERLVGLARTGHERAFEALVLRYRRPLLGYCRRLLLPNERAEDALQQGLLQAWLALQGGAEVRDVKPWLYRIVHNAALNMLRRSGYDYAELSETLTGAGAPPEDLDRRIAVREALAGLAALPEMQREALLRTAVDGSSYQQAAANMGLSEPALRGLVHRARATLRAAATALTPSPLLSWALGAGGGATDAPLTSRLMEAGAGGGSLGLAGLLAKAGATAVTAGVLVGGIGTLHHQRHDSANERHPSSAQNAAGERATQPNAGKVLASSEPSVRESPSAASPSQAHHHVATFRVRRAGGAVRRAARHRRSLASISPGPVSNHPTLAEHPGSPTPRPADASGGHNDGHSHDGSPPSTGSHNHGSSDSSDGGEETHGEGAGAMRESGATGRRDATSQNGATDQGRTTDEGETGQGRTTDEGKTHSSGPDGKREAATAAPASGAPARGRRPPPPHGSSSAGRRPAAPARRGGAGGRSTR